MSEALLDIISTNEKLDQDGIEEYKHTLDSIGSRTKNISIEEQQLSSRLAVTGTSPMN